MRNEDLEFRLEAAARVLERAAQRHPQARDVLLRLAESLRAAAESGDLDLLRAPSDAPAAARKTVEEMVEEIRRWIWEHKGPAFPRTREAYELDILSRLFRPIEELEKTLERLERLIPPL